MELTIAERIILANQYKILAILNHDEADTYNKYEEIIRRGYKNHYFDIKEPFGKEIDVSDSRLVWDIFLMFDCLQISYRNLENKDSIPYKELAFQGFSGNDETDYMVYAKFIVETLQKYENLEITDFNSHFPIIGKYQSMLNVFNKIKDEKGIEHTYALDEAEILSIVNG